MVKTFSLQLFLVLFLVLFITLLTNDAYANNKTVLAQKINQAIIDEKLAGIVWSSVSNDLVSIGSAGFSNTSSNQVMSHAQKVHVGSVTKTVLALGTLRLISEGKLNLTTKVAALLPELAINNPWQDTAPIRLKNLLEHTAGLDNIRMWQFLNTIPTADTPLKNAFPLNNDKLLTIRSEPGTQYSYSNMSYTMLAMVIEAVTSQRYERYLDKHFLQPLGMVNSSFEYVSQTGKYADEALAMGYFENNAAQTAVPSYLRPAGQLTTTAPDMAKFIQLIFNDGVLNGKLFIQPHLMKMLGYPDQTKAEQAGLKIGHGLAFAMRDRHGVVGMCHPGTTLGFRANICLFTKEKKAFFYAINTDSETADYEQFNAIFINQLSIKKAPIAQASGQLMDTSTLAGLYLPSPNNMAEFEWLDLVFNFKWLTVQDNQLLMKSLQKSDRVLLPLNLNLLRATDRTQASHAIFTDEHNDIYFSNGLNTYKQQPSLIIVAYWLSLILGLFGLIYIVLVGIYRILTKNIASHKAIFWPCLNLLMLSLPIFLYSKQSFLSFGELTTASFLLSVISGLLPLILLLSLILALRKKSQNKWQKFDCAVLLMSLQLCLVLFYWRVLPVIFWQ